MTSVWGAGHCPEVRDWLTYLAAGLAINLGYHRVLSHRALTLAKVRGNYGFLLPALDRWLGTEIRENSRQ